MTEYHYTSNFKIIADSLSLRGNAIAVGAREVRSGRVGLLVARSFPLMDLDPEEKHCCEV